MINVLLKTIWHTTLWAIAVFIVFYLISKIPAPMFILTMVMVFIINYDSNNRVAQRKKIWKRRDSASL